MPQIILEGKTYSLENAENSFVSSLHEVTFCDELGENYKPALFDNENKDAITPSPPTGVYYRIILGKVEICIEYEIYWTEQICNGKNHEHDYEQIQVFFSKNSGTLTKVVISSAGFPPFTYHGVHVYSEDEQDIRGVYYSFGQPPVYPWGKKDIRNFTEVATIPLKKLHFVNNNPAILNTTCYHSFEGIVSSLYQEQVLSRRRVNLTLQRLDKKTLKRWYFDHKTNQFGHDISDPFDVPHLKYYPPPNKIGSRIWIFIKNWILGPLSRLFRLK